MPNEQPYFLVRVTRCGECPKFDEYAHLCDALSAAKSEKRRPAWENRNGITPSCPMWAQRVEPPKD